MSHTPDNQIDKGTIKSKEDTVNFGIELSPPIPHNFLAITVAILLRNFESSNRGSFISSYSYIHLELWLFQFCSLQLPSLIEHDKCTYETDWKNVKLDVYIDVSDKWDFTVELGIDNIRSAIKEGWDWGLPYFNQVASRCGSFVSYSVELIPKGMPIPDDSTIIDLPSKDGGKSVQDTLAGLVPTTLCEGSAKVTQPCNLTPKDLFEKSATANGCKKLR